MTSIIERACRAICRGRGIDPDKQAGTDATTNPRRNAYPHARRPLLKAMQANRMKSDGWKITFTIDGKPRRSKVDTSDWPLQAALVDLSKLRPLGERYVGSAAWLG